MEQQGADMDINTGDKKKKRWYEGDEPEAVDNAAEEAAEPAPSDPMQATKQTMVDYKTGPDNAILKKYAGMTADEAVQAMTQDGVDEETQAQVVEELKKRGAVNG